MSIVSLVKVTTYGMRREKTQVLRDLQEFGCLHLMALNPTKEAAKRGGPSSEAREALRFLLDCPNRRKQVKDRAKFNAVEVERRALCLKSEIRALEDERDEIIDQIAIIKPWGDFTFAPLEEMKNLRFWFYLAPHYQMKLVEATPLIWQVVKRDSRFCYVIVIAEHEPEGMPVPRVKIGHQSLSELERRTEEIDLRLDELQAERASLSRWASLYASNLTGLENLAAREEAAQQTYDDEELFALQAWMPERDISKLEEYAFQHHMALEISLPAPDETPPTLLEEPAWFAMGKDLTLFYTTPGYYQWDPSLVVFFSFALFFAMIMADAGYALLLGGLLFFRWKQLAKREGSGKFDNLLIVIFLMSFVWGVMSGSLFGATPKVIASYQVIKLHQYDSMMTLSILIGVIHLVIANAGAFWARRNSPEKWASAGWGGIISGGFFLWLGLKGQGSLPLKWLGIALMLSGGGLAVWFSTIQNVWWKRLLGGLNASVPRLSGAFGDTLSYMRLFALGLAGASLSETFNQLSANLKDMRGIGMFAAALVLLFGHALNFALSLMGAVIHGLRLNYIEFFNWGMSEEGYLFKAFAAKQESASWKD